MCPASMSAPACFLASVYEAGQALYKHEHISARCFLASLLAPGGCGGSRAARLLACIVEPSLSLNSSHSFLLLCSCSVVFWSLVSSSFSSSLSTSSVSLSFRLLLFFYSFLPFRFVVVILLLRLFPYTSPRSSSCSLILSQYTFSSLFCLFIKKSHYFIF